MSVEILENLKEQTNQLTPQEKKLLAEYLYANIEPQNQLDLGLADTTKEEKRRLRAEWMKANREKYGGLYVALDGNKLLGTGKNYPEAAQHAKLAGVKNAFIDFVRPTDYVGEMGDW